MREMAAMNTAPPVSSGLELTGGAVPSGTRGGYSTVTLLARLRGLSMSRSSLAATW